MKQKNSDLFLLALITITLGTLPSLGDETFLTESHTNSISLKLLPIPAGEFIMGSPETEKGRGNDEDEVPVKLSQSFLMAESEVTQGQWQAVMGKSVQEQIETKEGPIGRGANLVAEASAVGPNQPICFVNWADAMKFCETLTKTEHEAGSLPKEMVYTLPTEAQWEYACRAGTRTVFSLGDTLSAEQANFYGKKPYGLTEEGEYREKTTEVKSFPPNAWGLYDMHGNLYEWCADWYSEKASGGTDPQGPESGEGRNIRGGTWNRTAKSCRSAYRYSSGPDSRSYNIGFRIIIQNRQNTETP